MKERIRRYEPEEISGGEVFDPDYHEEYVDVEEAENEVNESYDSLSSYLCRDVWDPEGFNNYKEWFEE